MTSYTIEGLEEYITYSITVEASNVVGSAVSEPDTGRTSEASELRLYRYFYYHTVLYCFIFLMFFSL